MPRYRELPSVGLYLEQVVKYINGYLLPVGCAEITPSMISNYVKKGIIASPQKKQYNAEQLAHLMFIAIVKNVLTLENIVELFEIRKIRYTTAMAYDYFCAELENMLAYVFGIKEKPAENLGQTQSEEKDFLRHVLIAAAHSMYISTCFSLLKQAREESAAK
ncbi:MAG: DUF1836 domain-containing protein [Clostridia bacterium]|nr:DUF1836 domain-containing protein [Clostridia bacterium]